ncbi:hypothetical protein C7T36_18305 [Rhodococcus sp. AD45-ID]|uniref:hypothetical protein n=1 Tax=unclassified Rhodococcus (in: high G+C Gram-positive bacteria) TaxID=192944 RepID=UPI0005D3B96F|nr:MULTISPECIES: hypothetical protein [unclassified Rhodococcus (in: high G+C Gram-positive bacteria)]KJF21932.1 hypothetical protein SZ00_02576 [Rhodococcus sp. AD45]PSR39632.1 hypothetical protein C7T36_18305 [Rhodococcus sp. AD45-ID]
MATQKKIVLWSDTDDIATFAHKICEDIRESDTRTLHNRLTAECTHRPGQMAQALMALAAWVNPEERITARLDRVERITEVKAANVMRDRGVRA